jgi:hypothetical protein
MDAIAVNPGAVPEFEIEKAPQHVAAICTAGGVIVEKPRDLHAVEEPTLACPTVEQHVAHHPSPRSARPDAERHREPHLRAAEDRLGEQVLRRLAQHALGGEPGELPLGGHRRDELDQLVIEERHAALDRCRHAHLVLLHQQFDQVSLDVGVEHPVEQGTLLRTIEPRA